jgi:hypothetical protein
MSTVISMEHRAAGLDRAGPGGDGVEVSVLSDFGVGAIDWRGEWFNPGA